MKIYKFKIKIYIVANKIYITRHKYGQYIIYE